MFEVVTLGSGSSGNSMLIRGRSSVFLVDAGMTAKQLTLRLATLGLSLENLSGVLLTHEHSDHASALKVLLSRQKMPVFCNALTARALRDAGLKHENYQLFQNGHEFTLDEFTVRPFTVPHDAADPVGFRITETRTRAALGVLTDLGYPTRLVFEMLQGIHALLIETNHDETLLQRDTRRPWSVKQRILSRHGHLSNVAAAKVVAELDAPELRHIIMGHLSRDCNSPELAETAMRASLTNRAEAIHLHCAVQETPSPVFPLI